jgi:phosphopantothenoylcysteine decarboxylase/phosphopantothenate--cysteine ligase
VARRVLCIVGGGIGAFKALELVRQLLDAGHDVEVVATRAALEFVGAASFSAIGTRPVVTDLFGAEPSVHTRLAAWAERIVVYPATADLLARSALGLAGDVATVTLLASGAPRLFVPAMHSQMWEAPTTRRAVDQLRRDGAGVLGPTVGRLAGGDRGIGRLLDPAWVLHWLTLQDVTPELALEGVRVLVTAGGTREPIDPVRFVSNRSSGRQGHALAAMAAVAGGQVVLVTTQDPGWVAELVEVVRVERAAELAAAAVGIADACDLIVAAAAVADFAPAAPATHKLKRAEQSHLELLLERTPDVLDEVVARRREGQVIVGFAAETTDLTAEVARKLADKGVDLMVGNDVSREDAGFDAATNAVVLADRLGGWRELPLAPKEVIAAQVLETAWSRVGRGDRS